MVFNLSQLLTERFFQICHVARKQSLYLELKDNAEVRILFLFFFFALYCILHMHLEEITQQHNIVDVQCRSGPLRDIHGSFLCCCETTTAQKGKMAANHKQLRSQNQSCCSYFFPVMIIGNSIAPKIHNAIS